MIVSALKKYALPFSLTLNVFCGTVIVTHMVWHGRPHHHDPQEMVEHIARTLPDADAAILRREFAPEVLPAPPRPGSPDDDFEQVFKAIDAEPFDPAALETVLRTSLDRHQHFDQAMAQALLRTVKAMSAEGRHRLARFRPPPPPP